MGLAKPEAELEPELKKQLLDIVEFEDWVQEVARNRRPQTARRALSNESQAPTHFSAQRPGCKRIQTLLFGSGLASC